MKKWIIVTLLSLVSCGGTKYAQIEVLPTNDQILYFNRGAGVVLSQGTKTQIAIGPSSEQIIRDDIIPLSASVANISDVPVNLLVDNIQLRDGNDLPLAVFSSAEMIRELRDEFNSQRWARALQGFGAGASGDPVQQAVFQDQLDQDTRNLKNEISSLKSDSVADQTIMPGSTYEAIIWIEQPRRQSRPEELVLTVSVGGDSHQIHFRYSAE